MLAGDKPNHDMEAPTCPDAQYPFSQNLFSLSSTSVSAELGSVVPGIGGRERWSPLVLTPTAISSDELERRMLALELRLTARCRSCSGPSTLPKGPSEDLCPSASPAIDLDDEFGLLDRVPGLTVDSTDQANNPYLHIYGTRIFFPSDARAIHRRGFLHCHPCRAPAATAAAPSVSATRADRKPPRRRAADASPAPPPGPCRGDQAAASTPERQPLRPAAASKPSPTEAPGPAGAQRFTLDRSASAGPPPPPRAAAPKPDPDSPPRARAADARRPRPAGDTPRPAGRMARLLGGLCGEAGGRGARKAAASRS